MRFCVRQLSGKEKGAPILSRLLLADASDVRIGGVIFPDLVSRDRDVVLVRHIFSSGKPQEVGNLE
jgi:hypothetical protein